jgi:hypothetical protein
MEKLRKINRKKRELVNIEEAVRCLPEVKKVALMKTFKLNGPMNYEMIRTMTRVLISKIDIDVDEVAVLGGTVVIDSSRKGDLLHLLGKYEITSVVSHKDSDISENAKVILTKNIRYWCNEAIYVYPHSKTF